MAGMVLRGTECKAIRHGKVSFNDAVAWFTRGELWLEIASHRQYGGNPGQCGPCATASTAPEDANRLEIAAKLKKGIPWSRHLPEMERTDQSGNRVGERGKTT